MTDTGGSDDAGHVDAGFVDAADLATVAEAERVAAARLGASAFAYLEGGAGGEWTLRQNVAAFDGWRFRPRVLPGVTRADATTAFLGCPLVSPIIVAPFGLDTLFHPDGHRAVARGAQAAGTIAILSSTSGSTLEDVRAEAPDAAAMFQVSALGPRDVVVRLAQRAAAAGFIALCMTLDTPRVGWRERSREDRSPPNPASMSSANYGPADYAARLTDDGRGWTWDDVSEVVDACGLPWIAKGILVGDDAHLAVERGAAAVMVSNHGGRQLDRAPATLDALSEVVDAVAGRVPVVVDGGVRRGSDVLVALALGASIVGVGRPVVHGLAAAGAGGVTRVLELLREELEISMVLTARTSLAAVDRSLVERVPPR